MAISRILVVDDSPTERFFLSELLVKNGYQATRMITKEEATKHIPVIMCTTKGQETDKVWGMRQGAKAYLVKPVKPEELLSQIKALG